MNRCLVKFEADNLIYNRFDLIYKNNVEQYVYEFEEKQYMIEAHYDNMEAKINVWGKYFPPNIFERVINDIFTRHSKVRYIEVKRSENNYQQMLYQSNDIYISLPETVDALLERVKAKHRYTIKREKRLLSEKYGKLELVVYKKDIPYEVIELYFSWKQVSVGKVCKMEPKEYLKNYYVSDALLLKAGETNVAVLFFCQVEKVVYLENFSYNVEMEKFSPGYLVYEMFLEELIKRKCSSLYLGGGDYMYKKRFGAKEIMTYSGTIYRKEVFEDLNNYLKRNNIKDIAIYGLGAVGKVFLQISKNLNVNIKYAIDKQKKQIDNLEVFAPEDKLESVDAVMITLKSHDKEVEDVLKSRFEKIYYWLELAKQIGDKGKAE